jgi:DNA-binding transcriptional LysR family regulator
LQRLKQSVDRLEAMQVFVTVAEKQSFAAAARKLQLSPARVTRAVASLEQRCGARLLHRTTRVVRLTDVGANYLLQCRRILSDVEAAETSAASSQGELHGQVSVTAPVLFGRLHVTPVLLAFLKLHPRVGLRALFHDGVVDLVEQNVDVAVRIAHLPASNLRAIRVGSVRRVVCAAPSYLRSHGTPTHPRDLREHELISFSGLGEPRAWSFQIDGKLETVALRPRLMVNSVDLALDAARSGHGLAQVLSYQVADAPRQPRLRLVLTDFEGPVVPVHVVHVEGRRASTRVRALVDFTVERLRAVLTA